MFGDIRAVKRAQPSCQWSCVSCSHPAGCNLSSYESKRKGLGFSALFHSFNSSSAVHFVFCMFEKSFYLIGIEEIK